MLVKVNTSLAGADFSFRFGEEVEQEVFAARVGNGWQSLCDAVAEKAIAPVAPEVAIVEPVVEAAVVKPAVEAASKKGRRR